MSTKKVLTKDERREAAIKVGLQLAKKLGAEGVSMAMIANKQAVSAPLLFHIFGTKAALVAGIKKLAKKEGVTLGGAPLPKIKLPAEVKKAVKSKAQKAVDKNVAVKVALPPPAVKKPTAKKVAAKKVSTPAKKAAGPVKTPAFKSLPPPFEASVAAVVAG